MQVFYSNLRNLDDVPEEFFRDPATRAVLLALGGLALGLLILTFVFWHLGSLAFTL